MTNKFIFNENIRFPERHKFEISKKAVFDGKKVLKKKKTRSNPAALILGAKN